MNRITLDLSPPTVSADDFNVSYLVGSDDVEIWLHGIVGDEFEGTDSASIGRILAENRGKNVKMRVNSPGGFAYDGVAIFNAILDHDAPTVGVIEGKAGSAASLAILGCDEVQCMPGGVFQPHYSLIMAFGHQAEIRDALAVQERLDKDLEQLYADASGNDIETVQGHLQGPNGDGTAFSAQEAKDAGYVDTVIQQKRQRPAAQQPRSEALARRLTAEFDELELTTPR